MKLSTLTLTFASLLLPTATLAAFSDVPESNVNFNAISYVQAQGIVSGYPDGTYRPDANINRAEFTKIVIGAHFSASDIQGCATSTSFSDTDSSAWYAMYLCMAVKQNIIGGYPDGTFKPAATINTAEAAKIIVLANLNGGVLQTAGADVWYQPYLQYLTDHGALPASASSPTHLLTRGEMAAIIFALSQGESMNTSSEAVSQASSTAAMSSAAAQSTSVTIQNFAFSPKNLTVKAGATVTWTNMDSAPHTVTGDNGGPSSGQLGKGQSYSYTFTTAGTFPYHCTVHPMMTASVTVTP